MINISINLSKLPKEKMKKDKSGNSWINLVIAERKEKSEYGETHTIYVKRNKQEREEKQKIIYCGSGIQYFETPCMPRKDDFCVAPDDDHSDLQFL